MLKLIKQFQIAGQSDPISLPPHAVLPWHLHMQMMMIRSPVSRNSVKQAIVAVRLRGKLKWNNRDGLISGDFYTIDTDTRRNWRIEYRGRLGSCHARGKDIRYVHWHKTIMIISTETPTCRTGTATTVACSSQTPAHGLSHRSKGKGRGFISLLIYPSYESLLFNSHPFNPVQFRRERKTAESNRSVRQRIIDRQIEIARNSVKYEYLRLGSRHQRENPPKVAMVI